VIVDPLRTNEGGSSLQALIGWRYNWKSNSKLSAAECSGIFMLNCFAQWLVLGPSGHAGHLRNSAMPMSHTRGIGDWANNGRGEWRMVHKFVTCHNTTALIELEIKEISLSIGGVYEQPHRTSAGRMYNFSPRIESGVHLFSPLRPSFAPKLVIYSILNS